MSSIQCKKCGRRIMSKEEVCPHCGEPTTNIKFSMSLPKVEEKEENTEETKDRIIVEQYVSTMGKSRMTSFFLTFFFGPLGLLYSSVVAGIILIVLAVVSASTVVGPLVIWILSIILGDSFTAKYNEKLTAQANFMRGNP